MLCGKFHTAKGKTRRLDNGQKPTQEQQKGGGRGLCIIPSKGEDATFEAALSYSSQMSLQASSSHTPHPSSSHPPHTLSLETLQGLRIQPPPLEHKEHKAASLPQGQWGKDMRVF